MKVDELNFFKKLIGQIIQKSDGCVDHNAAVVLGQGTFHADGCVKFIDTLVKEGWLQFR